MMSRLIIICMTLTLLIGCERRPLAYKQKFGYVIGIRSDWSSLDTKPLGKSVMCYPRDGGAPTVVQTNSVDYTTVALHTGVYDIVVFNQIPSDFGRLNFRGLEAYKIMEIYGVSMVKNESWGANLSYTEEPNLFAVETLEGFEVTKEMIMSESKPRLASTELHFAPPKVIYTLYTKIEIQNIQYLHSVRATISNMAGSYRFHDYQRINNNAAHRMEQWKLVLDENDKTKGYIMSTINTFGISDKEIKAKILNLSIQLKDKDRTVVSEAFSVDTLIKENESQMTLTLNLKLSEPLPDIDDDDDDDDDDDGGFNAEIGGWEDDINQDIDIK